MVINGWRSPQQSLTRRYADDADALEAQGACRIRRQPDMQSFVALPDPPEVRLKLEPMHVAVCRRQTAEWA